MEKTLAAKPVGAEAAPQGILRPGTSNGKVVVSDGPSSVSKPLAGPTLAQRALLAGKVGAGVAVGRFVIEGGLHTIQFTNGDLSKGEFGAALTEDIIKAAGSGS